MKNPNFSVIIPTYNRRHTIDRAIRSVLEQQYSAAETIIIDDGSGDGTAEYLSRNYRDIRLLRFTKNRGSAAARNAGIKVASHEHLAFLDSDDAWHPDYLNAVSQAWRAHADSSIVYTHYDKIIGIDEADLEPVCPEPEGDDQFEAMFRSNFIHTCSVMSTRRSLAFKVGGFDPAYTISHDRAMYLRLLTHGRAINIPKRLVQRYITDDNLVNDVATWWKECSALVSEFAADPKLARYRHLEDEVRSHLWKIVQHHDRSMERIKRPKAQISEEKGDLSSSESLDQRTEDLTGTTSLGAALQSNTSTCSLRSIQSLPKINEVFLFLHGDGVPVDDISAVLNAAMSFGSPFAYFDHDRVMLAEAQRLGADSFASYLMALLHKAASEGGVFSALVHAADVAWLKRQQAFSDLLLQPFRSIHLRYLDPLLQAKRLCESRESGAPSFNRITEALSELEQQDDIILAWAADHRVEQETLFVEHLAYEDAKVLKRLATQWSLPINPLAEWKTILPPSSDERRLAENLRQQARDRHWGHAFEPGLDTPRMLTSVAIRR